MSYCKANSCYNSKNYSWNDYCSYHKNCLERLSRDYSFNNIQEIETFETHFNKNCGYVINYNNSRYDVWLIIYEPRYKSIGDNINSIKHDDWSYLSSAKEDAQKLKRKLQNSSGWYEYPMLEVHPKANNSEYFSNLITSPYVRNNQVGTSNNVLAETLGPISYLSPIQFYSGCTPSDLDRYFKPLDIVQVKSINSLSGIRFYHVGVYLGDVGNGKRICHFSRGINGTRLTDWNGFLEDSVRKIVRYHPIIPFKNPRRIAEQIAWVVDGKFREDQYCLRNRNCEHLANMLIYGINYSKQIYDNKGRFDAMIGVSGGATIGAMGGMGIFNLIGSIALAPATGGASLLLGAASTGLVGAGTAVTVRACEIASELNNNKGSTIKLTNEMSESNGKLGERDNWLSDQVKANIEIPAKEYCVVM